MTYSILDPHTGIVIGHASDASSIVGRPYVPGRYLINQVYFLDGQPVDLPPKPGSGMYVWNLKTKSWLLDREASAREQRKIRDRLLSAVDRVNPIWYASLGVERQVALQEYRQALLAVPEQPGFPDQVIWPTKPPWL